LKLGAKYSIFLTASLMVRVLDTVMTFTMALLMTGWTAGFVQRFSVGWLIGFAVALPTNLAASPLIRRLVKCVCE